MNRAANNDWSRVREIFEEALSFPVDSRRQRAKQLCGGNESVWSEVLSLLDSHESSDNFLETPAVVQVAENAQSEDSQLFAGQRLLHYEIQKPIGSGGMGEVYMARDTRLNRNVAIKLLRASFLPDEHARMRLLREARAAALLEHPNICQIYEISETKEYGFIVMQYVVGSTLSEIMSSRQLPVDEALELAVQIAEGLSEAHSHGVIHRDIKPANIMVNEKGQVKILDFGLAKFIEVESNAPTSRGPTSSGAVMGTVPYMSPEQLRGIPVDARTDVFSFGSMVFEMLTGKPAFTRNTNADTIAAILNEEPDWSLMPTTIKPVIEKCLSKDKTSRYSSVRNMAADLAEARKSVTDKDVRPAVTKPGREIADTDPNTPKKRHFYFWQSSENEPSRISSEADTASESKKPHSFRLVPLIAVSATILLLGMVAVFVWQQNKAAKAHDLGDLRPAQLVSWKSASAHRTKDYRISHDGRMIAYSSSRHGGVDSIFVKQTSGSEDVQVTKDSWPNISPIWSPNDQDMAYVSIREGQFGIYVSRFLGGDVSLVLITGKENTYLRHWSRDGSSIFYERSGNLYRVDLASHESVRVTPFDEKEHGRDQFDFDLSPDETQLVFCAVRDGQTDIWTVPIAGGEMTRVTNSKDAEERPLWYSDGERIIYNVTRNDFVQIDQTNADGTGTPTQVTRGVGHYKLIGVSDDALRLYFYTEESRSDIFNVDLQTKNEIEIAAEADVEMWSDVSPDGKSIVYQATSSPDPTRRISDFVLIKKSIDGKKREQFPGEGFDPRWLPDGRRIAVFRSRYGSEGNFELWTIDTATREEKRLADELIRPPTYFKMPIARGEESFDFSSDGKQVVYLDMQKPRNAKLGSLADGEFKPITANEDTNVVFYSPLFSPDGKKISMVSFERFADRSIKPKWRLLVIENGTVKEIFSTELSIRLIGWATNDKIILSTTDGPLVPSPLNADVLAISTTGATSKIVSLTDFYIYTLALSADGKTIAFTARRDDRDDIWTMPVPNGRQPTRITSNSNSRQFLTNLTFGAGGKSIYFDKQEEINTISVFENSIR